MARLRYLLDTNICIFVAREKPPSVLARFRRLSPGSVAMSAITYGELRYGAERSQHPAQAKATLTRLCELIPALPLDETVAERHALVRAALEKRGRPIGNNDLWIAAHGLALGVTLVTHDASEFSRVPGLAVEDWAA